jgi:hypothetical protein
MTTSSLVQIAPLSQSGYEQMACGHGYRAVHLHHRSRAGNQWSALGQEAHHIISTYVEHLVTTRQSTDYEFFDSLVDGISLENIEGLDRVRETLVIDPEKVFGTEQYIALDEDFALLVMERVEDDHRSGGDPCIVYEGTLDMVLLHSPAEAEITDWKNHFLIATPDTFQSRFYPLLFCALPSLETVHFRLEYLRWGANRAVTFTRSDLPRLKRMAGMVRQRQRKLLQLIEEPKAIPHKGCIYCPLLLEGCPIDRANPYAKLSAKQRLRLQIYLDAARDTNLTILKEWAEESPVSVRDDNGVTYSGSFVAKSRTSYALDRTLPIIDGWDEDHPEDKLRPHLSVGASEMHSLAKARKKRPKLAETLSSVATVTPYSEFQISREAASGPIPAQTTFGSRPRVLSRD